MVKINPEYFEVVKEFGAESSLKCYQCGTCTGICPVSTTDQNFPRRFVLYSQLGIEEKLLDAPEAWLCLSCKLCTEFCPRDAQPSEVMLAIKRMAVESGNTPPYIRDFFTNIHKQKNPWGLGKFKREDWVKKADAEVPKVKDNPEFEWLWFVGCAHSFDNRNIEVTKKLARILNDIGVNFAILGREEGCCGNDVRRAGEEGLFELLMDENAKTFDKYGVERLFTHSPHCFNAFKNEYEGYEVKLILEIIYDAIKSGKLELKKPINKKVTYHDSCFLGRYNKIYDLPREILQMIPGVELVEMKSNREMSLCCGGGAGNIVGDYEGEIQPARVRAIEAAESGAEILAVACPFCLLMLEDGVKMEKVDDRVTVKDIIELIYESAYE
ncbi:tungsten-dependent benzoyl-CoA reductase-related protein bamD [Archaeoglobus sulfaticallidus PM70-1]|uniref:Tungsten-dependent benzoyl-CoA reductase-related protein bamD n=1 Tax=Archaeoglobus sulfaticallidus PM70-1 TaxID=387631 RepID=N0BM82_9EURY|nr:(Fe-S)-binding protein [Archaeoglobus sulfaticallidus]AGK61726.1 tungsten-dependent benzoyl-CoA reductase-related protein bamD [Archaeoglobus sulfaticallidus PM70-1]